MKSRILIVDDNEGILKSLKYSLKYEFEQIDTLRNPNGIPTRLREQEYDLILLDMNFVAGVQTGNEGFFWLKEILKTDPDAVVILITAYGSYELAVRAIKEGATDFLAKPWEEEKLMATLHAGLKLRESKKRVSRLEAREEVQRADEQKRFPEIIGESEAIQAVIETVKKVAATDAHVLITGENGVGKELIAREIHRQSDRREEAFITVDMASISESLFESEMFGHLAGSFTDAKSDRTGRVVAANGGSLFLDEIGNISLAVQAKILRLLQQKEVTPVGSNKLIPVDVRLISATNMDLAAMITEGSFREDLFYRINTIQIEIPPLRKRPEDIPVLAEYFLKLYGRKYRKPIQKLPVEAKRALQQYAWPGNIRELRHTMEKTVILSDQTLLRPEDFNLPAPKAESVREESFLLEDVEEQTVRRVMDLCEGNLSQAARMLGITRKTLYKKMDKYGL